MPQIAIRSGPLPVKMEMGSRFRPDDDELFELCVRNPELRIERTAEGDLIVVTPAGGESSHRNLEIAVALGSWAREDGTGVAFDSSGGFLLPNGAMRSPDGSWIRRSRLDVLEADQKRTFIPLCPDFVIELRSPSDSLGDLQGKMGEYVAAGATLGWLIDPEARTVYVYRPSREVEVLRDADQVTADPELPGFVLDLRFIWQPI